MGSLSPTFVSARRVGLAVKLPYAFTLFGRFPFCLREPLGASVTFWRRPPQSNCPPGTVPHPDYGVGLGSKHRQGGISTVAPPTLARQFHSLPPILHKQCPNSMPGCSKAPRGLFVLLRVGRIFTAISISPGPSLRQCSSCYTVRAGRNLPDKEFRYLRTVIVTAAVHRGFSSKLRLASNLSL